MITKVEVLDIIDALKPVPMHDHLVVLVPGKNEKTAGGIIKPDAVIANEKIEQFMIVLAVADDVDTIKVHDKVFIQGTVTVFAEDACPDELEIAPEGYRIGIVPRMYVKMKM